MKQCHHPVENIPVCDMIKKVTNSEVLQLKKVKVKSIAIVEFSFCKFSKKNSFIETFQNSTIKLILVLSDKDKPG